MESWPTEVLHPAGWLCASTSSSSLSVETVSCHRQRFEFESCLNFSFQGRNQSNPSVVDGWKPSRDSLLRHPAERLLGHRCGQPGRCRVSEHRRRRQERVIIHLQIQHHIKHSPFFPPVCFIFIFKMSVFQWQSGRWGPGQGSRPFSLTPSQKSNVWDFSSTFAVLSSSVWPLGGGGGGGGHWRHRSGGRRSWSSLWASTRHLWAGEEGEDHSHPWRKCLLHF